jgi:hypothetical protein
MNMFSEELKNLIKNHLRHSLCSTPISIQSRIYFDDEEISNLRQEKPAFQEPSVKEITDLWLDVVNNIPANDKRPREWHFANAILRKAQEK